jgi:23S rRNA (uridine2552-2'-O)-methyltransferase
MAKARTKTRAKKNPYARADHFTREAKKQGYPARSVFKLEEIDRRLKLFKPQMGVIDLGAAPGSWALYAAKKVGKHGRVIAIDQDPLNVTLPDDNCAFLQADIFRLGAENYEVLTENGPYDVVLSDMAPRTTGNRLGDQTRSFELFMEAVHIAEKYLKEGGAFVGKIFMGEDFPKAQKEVKRLFREQRALRPEGTEAMSCSS